MKKAVFVAALLGCTALTPEPAQAAPAVAFVQGAAAALAGTAFLGGSITAAGFSAGLAAGSYLAAGGILTGLAVSAVVSVGLSKLSQSLVPDVPQVKPSARMANYAQPISYAETVYGRTRKGGPLAFTGFAQSRRWYVPILAAHPIAGVVEHWLDEWVIPVDPARNEGVWLSSNVAIDDPEYPAHVGNHGRVDVLDGTQTEAHGGLLANFDEWTEAHNLAGLACGVLWASRPKAKYFADLYPTGREWVWAPVIDGHAGIYDPRTDTTGYSNNAALVMAHWITEVLGQQVDWDAVAIEADVCDEVVTNKEGGTQPKWTLNGTLSDDQEFEDQRALLAVACDAFVFERPDGKVGFNVGRWIEPTVTLTADDFLSLNVTLGEYGSDAVTEVAGTYIEPENNWREATTGTYVATEATKAVKEEPQLYMIHNHNQAARICKRIARTRRSGLSITGSLGMIGYELIGQRFVRLVHEEMGVDCYLEVSQLVRNSLGSFDLTASRVLPSDFDFDAATEEPVRPALTDVESDDTIPDITGLSAASSDGGALDFTWTDEGPEYEKEIRIQRDGETEWLRYTVPDEQDFYRLTGLVDGATYYAQIRNRTATGRTSDWGPETAIEVTVVANSMAPAAVSEFTVTYDPPALNVAFVAPNDPNYFATRIYRAADSIDIADAVVVRTEYGIPSNSDAWTDDDPASEYGTAPTAISYWVEPINSSGVAGPMSGPITVTL